MSKISLCPPEWDTKSLVEIATITTGGTPSTYNTKLYGNDHPFISPGDLGKSKFISTSEKMLSEIGWRGCKKFPHGAILFVCIGSTIGKLGVAATPVSANQQINGIVPNEGVAPDFLYYWLSLASKEVRAQASEQAVPIINKATFGKLNVFLPSLQEQEAIAEALSDADALIEGLERLITKKRLIKQGAMQELLTRRRRLPGFSGEWEVKRLAEIGQVKTGLTYNPKNVSPYGTLVLRSSNIQNDRLAFADNVFVDLDVSDEATVQSGDLLICVRNGSRQLIGKTAMIDKRADGMAFGAFMSAYRSDLNDYLIWCFQSSVIQKQVAEHLGATINQITNKTLKAIEVPIPTDAQERAAISMVLHDMDAAIQALETRLEKARAIKEGMMQNLLTGRVRLL